MGLVFPPYEKPASPYVGKHPKCQQVMRCDTKGSTLDAARNWRMGKVWHQKRPCGFYRVQESPPKCSEKSSDHSMFLCSFYPLAWRCNTFSWDTSVNHTSGKRYNSIAKFTFFWNILPRLSSKTSLILLPNKCLQWNFHFFSFSWGHLERFWFFNKYINTQVLLLSVKVFLTQLLTCQYFCWTFHLPFATHIQTHRRTFHPVTALTAD